MRKKVICNTERTKHPRVTNMLAEELTLHGTYRLSRAGLGPRETLSTIRKVGVLIPDNIPYSIRQEEGKEYRLVYSAESCRYFVAIIDQSNGVVITLLSQESVFLKVPKNLRDKALEKGNHLKYSPWSNASTYNEDNI